jgi:hypothetical protein
MRALIGSLDAALRQAQGVFEFCDDKECLFRLQLTRSRRDLLLCQGALPKGSAVLELHLWNEHIPALPPAGPDLVWASRTRRLFVNSLHAVGQQIGIDSRLANVQAVGGVSVLLSAGDRFSGDRMIHRLGFEVLPYHNRLGRFGEFWENLYSWGLMWAFTPVSLNHRQLLRLRRVEFWMSAGEFQLRYGENSREAVGLRLGDLMR